MDYTSKASMEKYIKELMEMSKRSSLPPEKPQNTKNSDEKLIDEVIDEYLSEHYKKLREASTPAQKEKVSTDIFLSALNWDAKKEAPLKPQAQDIVATPENAPQNIDILENDTGESLSLNEIDPVADKALYAQSARDLNDMGYIYFFVTAANQAFPVADAVITVSKWENGQEVFKKTVTTDRSGVSPVIALPAPDQNLSLTPSNVIPYETYTATIKKDGYYDITDVGLQVFGGQTAYTPVSMILLPMGDNSNTSLEFIIPENPLTNS